MRENLRHYLNIGTSVSPNYVLLGDGISSLTEEFNPESEQKQYINMASASNKVKSYAPSISVEKEYIVDEELQNWINEKIKLLPVGKNAETDYIRINILETPDAAGRYPAIKRPCTFQFDSIGGDGGGDIMNNMTLTGNGDPITGYFDVITNTFSTAAVNPTTPGDGE